MSKTTVPLDYIKFQEGPTTAGVNGATIEQVLQACIARLEEWNNGPFRCRLNSLAITDLQSAENWLNRRTADRQARGVEGTMEP